MEHINQVQGVLDLAPVSRIRRNHGLEHATLHVLSERYPGQPMAGHSDSKGYWILSNLSTEEITEAAKEALKRLQAGEVNLAIHPNCGTNLATSGVLAGVAASLAMFGAGKKLRENLDRMTNAIVLAIIALIVAQPLGLLLQEYVTTSGRPGNLRLMDIQLHNRGKMNVHRVITEG